MTDNNKTNLKEISLKRKIITNIAILLFGVFMGAGSKALDESGLNELPLIMQKLDITNFLGRFAIWIFIGACISIYSSSVKRAALNVFLFFIAARGSPHAGIIKTSPIAMKATGDAVANGVKSTYLTRILRPSLVT